MKLKNMLKLLIWALLFIPAFVVSQMVDKSTLAFTHVSVIPMDEERILPDQTVLVKEGHIVAIGLSSAIYVPEEATIINAQGKYMIPTLSDMHIHLEGDAWNLLLPPELKQSKEATDFSDLLFLYIANGVTTVEIMSALPEHIEIRDQIERGDLLGPRLILSRMIDGPDMAWPPPISTWVKDAEEAQKAVGDAHTQGYDRIKAYSFLSKASYDALLSTAKELNMGVDGHVPLALSVEQVVASEQNAIVHSEELMKFAKGNYSKGQIAYFAELVAESNTWITPTLSTSHSIVSLLADPEKEMSLPTTEYMGPMAKGIWSFMNTKLYQTMPEEYRSGINEGYESFQRPFTFAFHQAGGKILTGTDALLPGIVHGFSIHKELEELVAVGITPFEALKASTTNPFEFLGELENAGTVELGKTSNLLLLEENPLESISNTRKIYGILVKDRWIPKEEIKSRLNNIVKSYADMGLEH
ncbi:MAG: amidohydrolase family protein [Maribacter sp.]|nr:amidohydrolase family protein [Maribacter sp.]